MARYVFTQNYDVTVPVQCITEPCPPETIQSFRVGDSTEATDNQDGSRSVVIRGRTFVIPSNVIRLYSAPMTAPVIAGYDSKTIFAGLIALVILIGIWASNTSVTYKAIGTVIYLIIGGFIYSYLYPTKPSLIQTSAPVTTVPYFRY